jgi:membrane-bound metal-dependent hydrolase YbcI (DUF457 family)
MLPPGHVAAGYLVSLGVGAVLGNHFPELRTPAMIALGTAAAFLPDLDMIASFLKVKRLYFNKDWQKPENNHRYYPSHYPLLYLVASGAIFLLGILLKKPMIETAAIMFLTGTWSHFLLDSWMVGIKWLWPWSGKNYKFSSHEGDDSAGTGFLDFWKTFLKEYGRHPQAQIEAVLIFIAIIIFFSRQ